MIKQKIMRLKELRLQRGLTQQQIAEYIGVSRSEYSRYENGRISFSAITFIKFIELYDVSGDYIVGRSGNPVRGYAHD